MAEFVNGSGGGLEARVDKLETEINRDVESRLPPRAPRTRRRRT